MTRRTYEWYGFYSDLKKPLIREIPQFGELWQLPELSTAIIHAYFMNKRWDLHAGDCVIGTGKWKNNGDTRIRIKVMLVNGIYVWLDGSDCGLLQKIADCPE